MPTRPDTDGESRSSPLPACQRCKVGKKRCDRQAPKCTGCTKSKSACIIIDPVSLKRHSREYIHELEVKERELLERLGNAGDPSQTPAVGMGGVLSSGTPAEATVGDPETVKSSSTDRTPGGFVGENSGLSFLRYIFSRPELSSQSNHVLDQIAQRPDMPEASLPANEVPPFEEASALLENYFARFHVHHNFLLRENVCALFDRFYRAQNQHEIDPQDRFRIFMIFAISGVTRFRAGLCKEHPYGYYLAALQDIDRISIVGSAESIQNLLLIARFGIYHHIRMSLWDISHFCMRQCIELGYHLGSQRESTLLQEQKRRRVFWDCYILDRYSSSILGRPFAISDDDITIGLPVVTSDDVVRASNAASLDDLNQMIETPSEPTELSVFVHCIKLRRISSHIYTDFFTGRKTGSYSGHNTPSHIPSAGAVRTKLQTYLDALHNWRRDTPVFTNPRSLYERTEWYEFMMEKDKLALIRGAIHTSPKRINNMPPNDLLAMCLATATKVIKLYSYMLDRHYITWTRSYFQAIFTAGLSIVYCISIAARQESNADTTDRQQAQTTLTLCKAVLDTFETEMPDAKAFSVIFGELTKRVLRNPHQLSHGADPTPSSSETSHGDAAADQLTGTTAEAAASQRRGADTAIHSTHAHEPNFELLSNFDIDQDPLNIDWTLLDEMVQGMEADIGQYAWGVSGEDAFNWFLT